MEAGPGDRPLKVIVFGATGMVGQGVLRECLLDAGVTRVLAVGLTPLARTDPKLRQIAHRDFADLSGVESELAGYDACFFCLGVSSAGMSEADYTRVTYDYAVAAARALARVSPDITFIYVSGAGTDTTEHGRSMWARVKGRTENAVLAQLPNGYAFRPAFIQPRHGVSSKTGLYRAFYRVVGPLYPMLRHLPRYVTNSEQVGRAMLRVARSGFPRRILENRDIATL